MGNSNSFGFLTELKKLINREAQKAKTKVGKGLAWNGDAVTVDNGDYLKFVGNKLAVDRDALNVEYTAGNGIDIAGNVVSVKIGNGLHAATDGSIEVPIGTGLSYTSNGLEVDEADEQMPGIVRITHEVTHDDALEYAVTSDGVAAYAPNKKVTPLPPAELGKPTMATVTKPTGTTASCSAVNGCGFIMFSGEGDFSTSQEIELSNVVPFANIGTINIQGACVGILGSNLNSGPLNVRFDKGEQKIFVRPTVYCTVVNAVIPITPNNP